MPLPSLDRALLRSPFCNSISPLTNVPAVFQRAPHLFTGSVSDLVEVTCGVWLIPVSLDSGTCPPGVPKLLTGGRVSGAVLWVSCCRTRLWHPKPAAVVLPRGPFPAQPPQGLGYTVIPCTFPDDLGPFFSQLVPTALEQALDLHQLSILEDVSRGLLAAPGLS